MIRVSFDLLGQPLWWWGLLPLTLGLFSALYGVVFAAAQTDMKRLLAYSSIENIGIMFTGLGLAIVFAGVGMRAAAALTLIAVMYHAMNHAFMKSLLFLGTGAVLHATGERNLGHLGGLIHRMPWVAWLTLVGVLAIAGLPPLNGFVSEWLLLQSFLFAYKVPHAVRQHAAAAGRRAARAGRGARRLCHGQVLRRHLSRPAAGSHAATGSRCRIRGAPRTRVARARLRAARILSDALSFRCFSIVTQQLGLGGLPASDAPWWLLVPIPERAVLLRAAGVLRGHSRCGGVGDLSACASSITSACAKAPPGIADSAASTAACRTRRKDSASRFAICFSRSSPSSGNCPGPSTRKPKYRLEIGDRILARSVSALGSARSAGRRQGRLAAARSHCDLLALQLRHTRRLAGADAMKRIRLDGASAGDRAGAGRGAGVSRLGESVPSVAAE